MYIDFNGSARAGTSDYVTGSLTSTKGGIDISARQGSITVAGVKHAQPAQLPSDGTRREQLADPLLCRCESLLDNWSRLVGTGNEIIPAFRTATSRVGFVSLNTARRRWLGRTRDGAPVEFLEPIATTAAGRPFLGHPAPAIAA